MFRERVEGGVSQRVGVNAAEGEGGSARICEKGKKQQGPALVV